MLIVYFCSTMYEIKQKEAEDNAWKETKDDDQQKQSFKQRNKLRIQTKRKIKVETTTERMAGKIQYTV